MSERSESITGFLISSGWADATRTTITADASNRRYERLRKPDGQIGILMDAPVETNGPIKQFIDVSNWLRQQGLSAPTCHAVDHNGGLAVFEDFGANIVAGLADQDPARELDLYRTTLDVLLHLGNCTPMSELLEFTPEHAAGICNIAFEQYGRFHPATHGHQDLTLAVLQGLLEHHAPETNTVALRDFHAENLIWLPDRNGIRSIGLLDFQDAVVAHPAYDLVSLLTDVRREVAPETKAALVEKFVHATGRSMDAFGPTFAVMSLQRNLRILGVFARLALENSKASYLDLIPRVWRHIDEAIQHPMLAEIEPLVRNGLPVPTKDTLAGFRV